MKKNKMMRLASAMMVMTLMTTSVISGTFAKYVTSDSATDKARVAKWGVTVTAVNNDMFTKTYETNATVDDSSIINSVVSSTDDKLVAPGTKNEEGITFAITGTPEVACKVAIKVGAVDASGNVTADPVVDVYLKNGTYSDPTGKAETFTVDMTDGFYYPVVYTLTRTPAGGVAETVATGNLASVMEKFANKTDEYQAKTNLDEVCGTYKLTWAWAFESGNDEADTFLGNLVASGGTDPNASTAINFGVEISVTQID